jgi:hypothetical protein
MQILTGVHPGGRGSYHSIATTTVGAGGTANVTFSSIPDIYKHLQIRVLGRTARVATGASIALEFNSDTASNYSTHELAGDGSSASSGGGANRTPDFSLVCLAAGASASANIFGVGVCDILDYADTNKYKTVRTLTGRDFNGSGDVRLHSTNWRSTAAITSIKITDSSGANLAQYTSIALYGIKG